MANDEHPWTTVVDAVKMAPLKLCFLAHFILTTWGIQGYWSPDSYLFYNLLFFITLFWTIHSKDSADAPLLCLIIDISAILLDVIALFIYFPGASFGSADRFSVGMAILNLVLRPVSAIAINQVWRARRDEGTEPQREEVRDYQGI